MILAAFPALLFTVYSAAERRASTENQARAELMRLVKLAAMQQWQVVEGARQMMAASSQILFTLLSDRRRCTEYFASLLAQNRGAYHSMGLFASDGQLFCNAASWRDKVYSGDRLYFRLAKETGRFAVGEYQACRVTGKAGINFGFRRLRGETLSPVAGPDRLRYLKICWFPVAFRRSSSHPWRLTPWTAAGLFDGNLLPVV